MHPAPCSTIGLAKAIEGMTVPSKFRSLTLRKSSIPKSKIEAWGADGGARPVAAGAVDEDVHPPCFFQHLPHRTRDGALVQDVASNGLDGQAPIGEPGNYFGGFIGVAAEDEHAGARPGQGLGKGITERSVPAGDDGYFVFHREKNN